MMKRIVSSQNRLFFTQRFLLDEVNVTTPESIFHTKEYFKNKNNSKQSPQHSTNRIEKIN
jgi:hypothetical protein